MRAFEDARLTPSPGRDAADEDDSTLHIKTHIHQSPAPAVYLSQPALRLKKRQPVAVPLLLDAAVLVLLTPILPSSNRDADQTHDGRDPFEDLGRLLSSRHARVRHLPYLPGVGLTDVHRACLARAKGVVVVVVNEPQTESRVLVSSLLNGGPPTPQSPTASDALIDDQLGVARQAAGLLERKEPSGSIVLVAVGPPGCRLNARAREHAFDNTVHCTGRDGAALRQLASELFKTPINEGSRSPPKRRSIVDSP